MPSLDLHPHDRQIGRSARSRALHELAARRGETLADTVDRATRLLAQESIGLDLAAPLREDEVDWLDASAG